MGLEVPSGPEAGAGEHRAGTRREQWCGAGNGKLARSGAPGQALLGPRSSRLIPRSCQGDTSLEPPTQRLHRPFPGNQQLQRDVWEEAPVWGKGVRALPCPALLPARRCPQFRELCLSAGTPNPLDPAARVAAGLSPGAWGDQHHPAPVCQATRPPRAPLPQPSAKPHAAQPCRAGGEGRQDKADMKPLAVIPFCWPSMPCCWGHSWRGVEVRLRHPTTHWAQGFTCGHKEGSGGTGGVVQGLRSYLPMQKTRVPPLVGELSPTRPGAAEPVCHSEGSRCQLCPEMAKKINTRFEKRSKVKSTPAPRPKEEGG